MDPNAETTHRGTIYKSLLDRRPAATVGKTQTLPQTMTDMSLIKVNTGIQTFLWETSRRVYSLFQHIGFVKLIILNLHCLYPCLEMWSAFFCLSLTKGWFSWPLSIYRVAMNSCTHCTYPSLEHLQSSTGYQSIVVQPQVALEVLQLMHKCALTKTNS